MSPPLSKTLNVVLLCIFGHAVLHSFVPPTAALAGRKSGTNNNVSHSLRITMMQCINAPYKESQLHNCKMEQFPNGTVGLNISLTIPKVLNYLGLVVKTYYKYTTYRPFMIDWSIDYCQTARNRNMSPASVVIMKIIQESLPEYSYPCPQGNITYDTFWMFEPRYVLQTLPSGNYRMDIFIKDAADNTLIALQIFGAIRKQGIIG
ncbi:uncharacterized protein LOC118504960 [Anopheles stephensi]|uniref:MD-2-related lipid-recognition domain-containing protein n=1 Tax=Anopheles stephensi TaxID=30069 RepID=A0A182Y6P0_ANOST|nr:uncharacterized protein LOC118504960 [Anopheles stephensi]XP_035895976.1 uncharacterized protein LOC118504960 [Anopheles stephensi]